MRMEQEQEEDGKEEQEDLISIFIWLNMQIKSSRSRCSNDLINVLNYSRRRW